MPSDRSESLKDRAGENQLPRNDANFDRLFWRGRAIHDLQEAFTALQKRTSFGGWERVFLSAAIEHFRAEHFERSARAAQRVLSEPKATIRGPLYPREEPRGSSRRIRRTRTRGMTIGVVPPVGLGWLLPAVPEAVVVLDLVEGGVKAVEVVPDTPDDGPHIGPIAVGTVSGDEPLIVQPVVDRPVCHVPTHVRSQQVDDVVFTKGEAEINILPIGPAYIGSQKQFAADHRLGLRHHLAGPRLVRTPESPDHAFEAPGQNLRAP